jgi:beta-phosphoglucomutase-like phosphatase (HAD superfamily)
MNRAIIFDVDGTLSETEETHRKAFNRAFEHAGLSWHWDQELYRELLGVTGGKERIRHYIEDHGGAGAPADNLDDFIRAMHAEKTRAYTQMVTGGEVELRPGIRKLISDAQSLGYRLAIATTTTPANVDALLGATFGDDGHDLFEVICAGDSVPNKKPAPDVYLLALEQLGLPAEDCIAIEDSRNGLLSAVAAGIATIVTPGIYTHDHDFDEAALVIEDLESLDLSGFSWDGPVERK